jgi:hypothetical protein
LTAGPARVKLAMLVDPRPWPTCEVCVMDLESRMTAWWNTLTDDQRRDALNVIDEVPWWMAVTLDGFGILTAEANLAGHSRVALMPTQLRAYLECRRCEVPASGRLNKSA